MVRALVTKDPPPERLSDVIFAQIEGKAAEYVEGRGRPAEPGLHEDVHSFDLHTELPVYAAIAVGNQVVQSTQVDSVANEVVFRLTLAQIDAALGSVHLRVVDEHGDAPQESGSCIFSRSPTATTTTLRSFLAKNGEGRIERLMPGLLGIELRIPGYARVRVEVLVESGRDLDLGEFRLEPEVTIRGRVLDPAGRPATAWIECLRLSGDRRRRSMFESTDLILENERPTTRPDGSFEIPRLGRDKYVLRAHPLSSEGLESGPVLVNTRTGSPEGVELHLLPATQVEIRLVNPPKEIEQILIEDDEHRPFAEQSPSTTQDAGFQLPIGHYTALATAEGQVLAKREFDVGDRNLVVSLRFD